MATGFEADSASPRGRRLRGVIGFAAPHWRAISLIIALMLVVASLNAVEPLIFKLIFDGLGTSRGTRPLLIGIGGLAAILLARELMESSANCLTWRTRIVCNMRFSKPPSASCIACRSASSVAKASARS